MRNTQCRMACGGDVASRSGGDECSDRAALRTDSPIGTRYSTSGAGAITGGGDTVLLFCWPNLQCSAQRLAAA